MCGRAYIVLLAVFSAVSAIELGVRHHGAEPPIKASDASDTDLLTDVGFYLYTKDSKANPIEAHIGDETLFEGKIDISKPVKILTHGYFSSHNKLLGRTLRDAYLQRFDYNIINVDWSKEAHSLLYSQARKYVPAVGRTLAFFIDKLANQTGLKLEELHLLGHSLGAHISGVAGLNVQKGRIMRITGFDPAGPKFSYDDEDRLKPEAASFVDVIHTCGHVLGFFDPLGHVDFYPNQGTNQPGCLVPFGKCSHERGILFYAESLSSPYAFVSRKCGDWKSFQEGSCDDNPTAVMGEHVSWDARGEHWLKTNKSSPFGMGLEASYGKPSSREADSQIRRKAGLLLQGLKDLFQGVKNKL